MAESKAADKLYTLTEVAQKTKISMPTLQRYKKLYQARIPSKGKGRSQRYPEEALEVFLELKKENIGKRGRPRKNASSSAKTSPRRPSASKRARKTATSAGKAKRGPKTSEGLLTLTQVSKMTGISYPTLLRYVKTHLKEIPHRGAGRARRFLPEAVAVFEKLRGQSKRGRKSSASKPKKGASARKTSRSASSSSFDASALIDRIKELEKTQKKLERMLNKQQKQLDRPFRVVLKRK